MVTSPAPQIDHDPGSQDEETTDSDDEQPSLRTRSKTEATGSPNNSSTKNKSKICITNRSFGRNLSGSSKHQLSHSEVPSKATLESASVEASQHLLCGCLVPIVLGMVIALICIYSSLPGQNFLFVQSPLVQNDQAFWNASIKKLREDLGLLSRKEFPGQDEHSWPVLRASIRSVLKEDPHMPSVILMVSDESGAPTAKCLAQKIGCEVNKLLEKDSGAECLGVESGKFSERSDLFTAMETRLVSGSSASFTLFNIQDLSGNTAMALHAFCDNDSAPFKQASIVMTLIAPDDVFNNEDTTQDIADKVLSEAWGKDLDSDRVSPILSRVVISAVKVAQESAIPC